jgi:hypothetical protein
MMRWEMERLMAGEEGIGWVLRGLLSFWWYWGLNSVLHLEPLHQPFFVMDFLEIGSLEQFPRLASNRDSSDLCLLSS